MFSSIYSFLTALSVILGVVTGFTALYQLIRSHQKRGTIFILATIVMILLAIFFANLPGTTVTQSSAGTSASTSGNTHVGDGITPTLNPTPTPTPTPSPTPQPTPTPSLKPGDVLYQAPSTWSGWNGTADWKVNGGLLLNTGTYADYNARVTIVAPYQSQTADYAVDMQMQVVSAFTTGTIYPCFYITIRGKALSNGWQGYTADVCANLGHGPAVQIMAIDSTNNISDILSTTPLDPQHTWHHYRVEAKGTTIKFFMDDGLLLSADDSRYLDPGQIGLLSEYMQVKLSSFKVTML